MCEDLRAVFYMNGEGTAFWARVGFWFFFSFLEADLSALPSTFLFGAPGGGEGMKVCAKHF